MTTYDRLNYTQKVIQGDTWNLAYQIKQVIDGVSTPVDITGWTFEGWVSVTRTSPEVDRIPMTATVISAAQGQVKFSIDETLTETMQLGSLYYQIRYTVSGDTTTIFRGPFMVQ